MLQLYFETKEILFSHNKDPINCVSLTDCYWWQHYVLLTCCWLL